MRAARAFPVVLVFLAAFPLAGGSWRVTTWTSDDALPQGVVYDIHQTGDGYIWLTTLGGLVRYDGVEFTVFEKATTAGLRTNRFTSLLETRDGSLWAGTEDGFVTRYRAGEFRTWSIDGTLTPVMGISAESSHPWAYTTNGLFQFDGTKFVRAGPSVENRRFLYLTGSTAVHDEGVTILKPGTTGRFFPFERLPDRSKTATVRNGERSTWIVDVDRGIFEYREGMLRQIENEAVMQIVRNAPRGPAGGETIGGFTRTADGAFWISQASRGIARVEGSSVEWITPADGLAGLDVARIYEDREGTIWITTRGSGISAIRRRVARTWGAEAGLMPPNTYPILLFNGELHAGTWGGGVYRFDGERFHRSLPAAGWVLSLADGGGGTLWASIHNAGVARVREGEVQYFGEAEGMPSPVVSAMMRGRDGTMWFGTARGLAAMRSNDDRVVVYAMPSAASASIHAIVEEPDGALLLGTRGGLLRFRDGRTTVLASERNGLSSDWVRAIHLDGDGTVWIGTYDGGLNRLRKGSVSAITTRHGLFDNGVFGIVEESGFFWMSSNRGVHRASRRDLDAVADGAMSVLSAMALTRVDGMLSSECNGGMQPAAAKTPDGRLWFPTQRGIVAIDPRLAPADRAPPPIVMTAVAIDGETRPSLNEEVRIGPRSRRVEFRFAAPSSVDSLLTRYRYKLEGFDRDWNEIAGDRVAAYTSLPPGRYRFVVTASNAAGRWNEKAATMVLRVLPPFWSTWWFRALAIAAGALLLWTLFRLRIRTIEREHAAQAAFSQRLLIQQEEERKRVAGELHDSLGQSLLIIKNRALLGLDSNDKEQLHEISATASAAIDEVRRIAHNLRPVELDHLGLTRSLQVLINRMSSSSPILFSADLELVDKLLTKEAEVNVFRIVQEWLSNVARHSKATAAVVSLRRRDHHLRLRIHDDGSGAELRPAQQGRVGIGLRSIAERVEMLGGTYDIRSKPGEGTAMTIEVPLPEGGV